MIIRVGGIYSTTVNGEKIVGRLAIGAPQQYVLRQLGTQKDFLTTKLEEEGTYQDGSGI